MESFLVTEGFGVCGAANNIEIKTTTLHSCSAIILFNAPRQILGLFHYPAENLTGAGIQGAILSMINDIAPTQLVLWTANPPGHGYGDQDGVLAKRIVLDNAKLRTFLELKKASNCTLEVVTGRTFPGVTAAGSKLVFTHSGMAEQVPGKTTIQAGKEPVERSKRGNIWFYYGSTEGPREYSRKIGEMARKIVNIERGWD